MHAAMPKGRLLIAALAGWFSFLACASGGDDFSLELKRAAELNLTAPWQVSDEILDGIEPGLTGATPEERATFELLRIRNVALAGYIVEGLERLERLLLQPLPSEQKLEALVRGANLGLLARRFEDAFDYLYRGLDLARLLDRPEYTTSVYSLASQLLRDVGEIEAAIEHAERALAIARSQGLVRNTCVASMRLATALHAGHRPDQAVAQYQATLASCGLAEDPVFLGAAQLGLGMVMLDLERPEAAETHLVRALELNRHSGYALGQDETRLALARLYRATGRTAMAMEMLEGLPARLEYSGRWDDLATLHGLLAEIARDAGDYALALEHAQSKIRFRERFVDVERARQLAFLETKFESRSQDHELALLHEQRRVSELREQTARQRRQLHGAAYAFGGVLAAALLLLLMYARRDRRHYRRLARIDRLTGLSNHTRFFDATRTAIRQARLSGRPLVLLLGDIDHFKQVNDTHGHLAGDQALREVAEALDAVFAERGFSGRVGGEEFAVCIPGGTPDIAREALLDLRDRIRRIDCLPDGTALTMSFGVAQLDGEESLESLRRRADEALYQAKHAGRNTTIVAAKNNQGSPE
jgi:diguanylate cyclase (GGDEF)-like protein